MILQSGTSRVIHNSNDNMEDSGVLYTFNLILQCQNVTHQTPKAPRHSDPNYIEFSSWNSSQEPPESSTTQTQDFEDMSVLCNFKFNVESWILEHKLFGTLLTCLHQDQEQNSQSGTSRVIQTPTKDYKDMRVLCLFKFNVESSIWEHRLFGTLLTRPYHHQEPKPQSKPPESSTRPTKYFEDMRVLCPLNSM